MKNIFKFFVTFLVLVFAFNVSIGQPTYSLSARHFTPVGNKALTFDIVLTHTNAETMQYAGGQYFFDFNPASGNGGVLTYSYAPGATSSDSSDLIPSMRPRNPQISGTQLRLAANSLPGAGSGPIFPEGDSIKIIRMKLETTAPILAMVDLSLTWRNGPVPPNLNPVTKINVYINNLNVEVTTPQTHSIDCDSSICTPLPVELSSFTAAVSRNNVTLNWSTVAEINNQGFDIERKSVNSNDWTRAANVAGNGTTTAQRNYSFNDRVNTGKYNYRLKQIDLNGNFQYHDLSGEVEVGVPSAYSLSQNYPNPFNPSTKVDYDLPYDGKVSIILYDISGREVANLVNDVKTAGYYTLQFNASNLASGLYFYRITAQGNSNNFVQTKKMVLVK